MGFPKGFSLSYVYDEIVVPLLGEAINGGEIIQINHTGSISRAE